MSSITSTTTKVQTATRRTNPKPNVILDAEQNIIRIENVLSARGILCSGDVVKISEYSNIVLISDDEDGFIHVIYRANIGLELDGPNIKRDKEGNKHLEGGFIQPLTAPTSKDPIVQSRHTNPL